MNKKRVELSVHTNMSALDGINDVGDYINEAMRDLMPAIAITDHSNVQAFPAAYKIVNKCGGIKLIYGAELFYKKDNDKFPLTVLVKNQKGLKDLYKLISEADTKSFDKVPLISLDEITELKENLVFGISILNEPIYKILYGSDDEKLLKVIKPFDYVMLNPLEYFNYFISQKKIKNKAEAAKITQRVIELCEKNKIMTVASDDAHYVFSDDGECRKILLNYKGFASYNEQPNLYLRTTEEMLKEFDFLNNEKAYKIVVENTNIIADMVDDTFAPFDEAAQYPNEIEKLRKITEFKACEIYGGVIPDKVKKRIDWELEIIGRSGKSVTTYLIAAQLAETEREKGDWLGSCETVTSSLVAYLTGITAINPMKAQYNCKNCNYTEFHVEENSCINISDRKCPKCGANLQKIDFSRPPSPEIFFGLNGEKEIDIDLDIPEEWHDEAIGKLATMYDGKIIRCGTINYISPQEAYSMIKKYCRKNKIKYSDTRENELVDALTNIKKNEEIFLDSIFVIPKNKEIYDYTPIQYLPNNDTYTTAISNFDCNILQNLLLKIDLFVPEDSPITISRWRCT